MRLTIEEIKYFIEEFEKLADNGIWDDELDDAYAFCLGELFKEE